MSSLKMSVPRRRLVPLAALALTALAFSACSTTSADVEEDGYYSGKSIEVIVPASPGGAASVRAQFINGYLQEHLAGHPRTQVTNVGGGGGILGGNQFALQRDHSTGEVLALLTSSALSAYVLGDPAVQYELGDMTALMGMPNPRVIYFSSAAGVETAADLLDPDAQLIFGTTGPTGADMPALFAFEALGLSDSIRFIFGYEGTPEIAAAFQEGELTMNAQDTPTFVRRDLELVESGEAVVLFTLGVPDGEGGLKRDPLLPDIPHVGEFYEEVHGTAPSGKAWDAFIALQESAGQSLWIHGDAPQEAVDALEAVIAQMLESDEFREADEIFPSAHPPLIGAAARTWGKTLASLDPAILEYVQSHLTERFDVEFE